MPDDAHDTNDSAVDQPSTVTEAQPQVLCLGGSHDQVVAIQERFGDQVQVVRVSSPVRAMAELARGEYIGVYADAEHFSAAFDAGRVMQNQHILQSMPDGVVLLNNENVIVWSNGRLCEWMGVQDVVGKNLYSVMGDPEILGSEFCPFSRALTTDRPSASTLRCNDSRCYRVHAAPVFDCGDSQKHLIVTLRDVTEEYHEQQKIANIHQAGIELADLTTDDVADMDFEGRVELLKDNILHCTEDVLQYDVVEIRMLDQGTGALNPLLSVGMKPEAEARTLWAKPEGNGVTGFVAATGKSYLCEDASKDSLYLEGSQDARSSMTVPLVLHDDVIGTFNVESPEIKAFTTSDLQFVEVFCRDLAVALNTLELLAAEKATTAAASVEAIHSAVARPVDDILNDAVNVMERYIGHEPAVVERLQRILMNARDIKQVIQKVGQTMAPIEARPAAARIEQRPGLVGARVLVVDEDESVRSAAHALLDRYHCVVETAHDGNEAVFMVRNLGPGQHYDAIISDIRLPDMSGHQLMLKLAEMSERVPLILMTGFGYDPGHSIVKARQAGLKHVLYKPFRLDQLLEAVEQTVAPIV
ncbi:response regulator [Aeoliella sp.]|uniref:response regulator n=1 Tax=Aeoliella sp. TaxID=2795800 RepID=UPI003CCC1B0C